MYIYICFNFGFTVRRSYIVFLFSIFCTAANAEVTMLEKTKSVKKETVITNNRGEMHVFESSPSFIRPLMPLMQTASGKSLM